MAAKRRATPPAPQSGEPALFRGFGAQALPFLQELRANNDRTWFAANKATFLDECDAPFRELVQAIGLGLESRQIPLAPLSPSPVFRIYRDVRFSRDKSPYKTHLGAALHPAGDKSRPGLLYVHIEPGGSFLAAGFYQPGPPLLNQFRTRIAADPAGFGRVVESLGRHHLKLDPGDPLTRAPRGFENQTDGPGAAALRMRSLTTSQPLDDADLERRDLPAVAVEFAAHAWPLLAFFLGQHGQP